MTPSKSRHQGFTLMEIIIALGLSSLVVYAVIRLYNSFDQSSKMHALMETINDEQNQMVNTIEKSWGTRYHIDPNTGRRVALSAQKPSFRLIDAAGLICPVNTNCVDKPKVEIDVDRPNAPGGKDIVTVETKCINPGAIAGLATLNGLSFTDPTACIQCAKGTVPVVRITSQNFPGESRRFPTNGANSPSGFKLSNILGMSACWSHSGGDDPAFLTLRSFYLRKADDDGVGKLTSLKTNRTLPFDNLSKLKLTR